jgi:tetratricopeptide (TPR) repeat protein
MLGLALAIGCGPRSTESAQPSAASESQPVIALSGTTLPAVPLSPEVRAQHEARLAAAREAHDTEPTLETTIWLGRRTAYLGRYHEAIEIYTQGLQHHGDDPALLRHRGHRYVTTRQFELALADFERAAALVEGTKDVIEADGLPNAAGIPTSTLHTNIHYHLGLTRFLLGDFTGARSAYEDCLRASTTDDMRVATAYWLAMVLVRLGDENEADVLLATFADDIELYENFAYLRLLRLYQGVLSPDDLLGEDAEGLDPATLGFGLGHWYLLQGDRAKAQAIWRNVLDSPQWAAFGYIAAEAELHRGL